MTTYETLKLIIEILKIMVWPIFIIIILLTFKKNIKQLFDRTGNIEGSLGSWNFKLQAKDQLQKTVKEAINLEKLGKKEDADKLISDNTEIISQALGLTENDIHYLIDIKEGKKKGRWGKVHLANAGLIQLDGGDLTEAGQIIIDRFLKHNKK
ncbi:hypothetical protein FNO01nite_28180 [Flavobacterium noncentrifugens]|uniref:Uncharacterized protein n=1 Tax=Flavobacterium noncentrifugens TaxID=1128970 RepID=A0A1G9CU52_9FLAO|nr:hypothetical protein [Flavobacterium noncentrifugens]GEP52146.1 hypothetical protein FNO01nite_28180 [Flavobacterium noncentrifugens]SDK54914.1 hypothetical protein SAMN04487935_3646 [Flavobacterium noncentrifugens]